MAVAANPYLAALVQLAFFGHAFRIEHDHRAETNLNNHPCIHQALLAIWQKLEDMELAAAIPELEPPAWILPAGQGGEPEPDGDVVEVNGLVLGTLDRRDERE